jgi:hypothetical protein
VHTLGRLTKVQQAGQSGGNAVAAKRVDFAYDAAGRDSTITRYANTAGTQLVATTNYTYDDASRLTALSHTKGATTLAGYGWTYDSSGRPTQFTSTLDGTANYTYDNTDQLTGATYTYQTNESYSYDANGNRTNTGYSTTTDNRLASDGVYNYTYDNEGNRTRRTKISDGSVTDYTWDYRNRLTNVTERATVGGAATKSTDFVYDVNNRLVQKVYDPDGAGAQAAQSTFDVFDGAQIALEFNGSQATNLKHRYLWGPAVDQILADETVTSLGSAGSVVWPLADNLGTARDLAQYNSGTDTTAVANHRVYDSFGNLKSETNAAVDLLFGYTGAGCDEALKNEAKVADCIQNRWAPGPLLALTVVRDITIKADGTYLCRTQTPQIP